MENSLQSYWFSRLPQPKRIDYSQSTNLTLDIPLNLKPSMTSARSSTR